MRRSTSFYAPHVAEKAVQRLEDELDEARHAIVDLMPDDVAQVLSSYVHCESRSETYGWESDVSEKIIERAKVLPHKRQYDQDRAYCPLCGRGSTSPYTDGFTVPEGLSRHLTGYGNVRQCVVMTAARRLAQDYWERQFREGEQKEKAEQVGLLAQRKRTETLYLTAPDREPQLLEQGIFSWLQPRSATELAWAEERLTGLGFQIRSEANVKSYTCERDDFVIYADPRTAGEITFRVYRKPLPKRSSRARVRTEPWFRIRDSWKNDLRGKFEARLAEATRVVSLDAKS